ncbi:MAG: MarR family EPS-associated transcriptional regulator [Porticoccaceae bacterium]|nr:MarR family EPS-associated transcriptional regulator [Porticoccaceae bacterium]
MPLNEETHYRILKLLQEQPDTTQRELARELGISLGKVNYCMQALIKKGLVKAGNFRRNPRKSRYAYFLTPKGIEEKTRVALCLLKQKAQEYESLKRELRQLRHDAGLVAE